jgi:hypothetical protein
MEQADWPDKGLDVRELQAELTAIRCSRRASVADLHPADGRAKEGSMPESQAALISATSAGGPSVLYERTENLLMSCM